MFEEKTIGSEKQIIEEQQRAKAYTKKLRGLYLDAIKYSFVAGFLLLINLSVATNGYWFIWPTLGLAGFLLLRAVNLTLEFKFFNPAWQNKITTKYLANANKIKN